MDRNHNSNDSSALGDASRCVRTPPTSLLAPSPSRSVQLVSNSPMNIRKQPLSPQQQLEPVSAAHSSRGTSSAAAVAKRPSPIHALPQSALALQPVANERNDTRGARRARPTTSCASMAPSLSAAAVSGTTVAPLATTATLDALLARYHDDSEQQTLSQSRPDSAPETRVRKQLATVAPLTCSTAFSTSAFGSMGTAHGSAPATSTSPLSFLSQPSSPLASLPSSSSASLQHQQHQQRQSQRCAGCGAFAEMCLSCFARFKQQDIAMYKAQLVRSVDVLFAKAVARASTKRSAVLVQWLFGVWKSAAQRSRRRDAAAVRWMQRQRQRKSFRAWHDSIFRRRIVGAMLYAETQQRVTRAKSREIATLHGDVFSAASSANVQDAMARDALAALEQQCTALQQRLAAKNDELLALRRDAQAARDRAVVLETQAVDPREFARLTTERADYKKVAFQLATALCQHMESQVEQLAATDGRHNVTDMLSKELLQAIDRPECQAFYNPHVALERVSMAASASGSGSSSTSTSTPTEAAAATTSFFTPYDAPTDRAEKILMQWVNALVHKPPQPHSLEWLAPIPRMLNLHASLADGKLFVALTKVLHHAMSRNRPKRPSGTVVSSNLEATSMLRENGEDLTEVAMARYVEHMRTETNADKRMELMLGAIGQAMWLPVGLLTAKDVLAGDAELNFAVLAYLFATHAPTLDDAFVAGCSDMKQQLASVKATWRDLRDGGDASSGSSGNAATSAASSASSSNSHSHKVSRGSTTTSHSSSMTGSGSSANANRDSNDSEDATRSSKMKLVLAHSLELKRRLDTEDQRAREGHSLWNKSLRIVLRKCFVSFARLARGQAGVLTRLDAAGDENAAFATAPLHKLADLALAFEDFAWECKLLQSYLVTIHCDLARIYRGYATRSGVVHDVIGLGDVLELLAECRVLDASFTVNDVHAIMKKIDPKQTSMNAHRALPPVDFLEALIRIARKKYTAEHHRITISEAFCLFTDSFILPFAFRADADLFRTQIEDPKIRRLLLKYGDELRDLYGEYAVDDALMTKQQQRTRKRMTAYTFSKCLVDKGIQDVTFNAEKVLALLQKVVRTKRDSESSSSATPATLTLSASDDNDVTFAEFEEAMIAIACHKFPDPYVSLESRVERFLAFYVRGVRGEAIK